MSDYELQRRLQAVERGKDPLEAYKSAGEALKSTNRTLHAAK
jgi:hypothetical protein